MNWFSRKNKDVGIRKVSTDDSYDIEKASRTWAGLIGSLFGREKSGIIRPQKYDDYAEVFKTLPWIYSSIYAIAVSGADLPVKLYWEDVDNGELTEIKGSSNRLRKLLNKPNETDSWFDIMESTLIFGELAGDAYWEKVKNALGQTIEIYSLRPDRVKVIPGDSGQRVKGYSYQVSNRVQAQTFEVNEIIHFKYFNPTNDWYGLSSIVPATNSIILDQHCIEYNKEFFMNDATPAGILSTDKRVTEESSKRILKKWQEWLTGRRKSHRTVILPEGLQYQSLGISPKDMEFGKMRLMNREEMMATLGVNNAILGLTENMTYDNYRMQIKAFFKNTMMPKLRKLESAMNAFLAPEFEETSGENKGKRIIVRFDLSAILGEDINQKVDRLERLFRMGAVSPNMIIKELELGDSFDQGKERYVSTSVTSITKEPDDSDGSLMEPSQPEQSKYYKELNMLGDSLRKTLSDILAKTNEQADEISRLKSQLKNKSDKEE